MERRAATAALIALGLAAAAPARAELRCHHDRVTDRVLCIDEREVRRSGLVRTAPLLRGGPERVRRTAARLAVNCATREARLIDEDGVAFGIGPSNSTEALDTLSRAVCEAVVKGR